MRYLLTFLFLSSVVAFAQEPPNPICGNRSVQSACTDMSKVSGSTLSYFSSQCYNGTQGRHQAFETNASCSGEGNTAIVCYSSCTCPDGFQFYQHYDDQGKTTSGCSPSGGGDSGSENQCGAGQVFFEGFCRDGVASPGDCGSTYTTAVRVGDLYACSNSGCSAGQNQNVFTNANGSWNVCGGDGDGQASASSGSNTSSGGGSSTGNSSAPSSNGSGGDSSSGSGSGSGGNGGNGDGGTNNPPTQSSSSVSSANGAASSGSGAGNCDPTSYDYLDCISREKPGLGNGDGDAFEPSGGKGSFDGDAAQKRRDELEQQIADEIENIKQEIAQELGGSVRGSGTITDECISLYGKQVCFGLAKFSGDLALISQAVFMCVCVICVGIVLRN